MRGRIVAVLEKRGRFLVGIPFFPRHAGDRHRSIAIDRSRDARPGRLVVLGGGSGRAKIERVLGKPDVARDVIEALMIDRGLMRRFPPGVERAAKEAIETVERGDRQDLRDLPTFTIDPATAKDFDDAISAQELGSDHWRIWVHIADVSAYVKPGSQIDREAYRRATSVYVPGAVEPMLPESLSNGACSLVPGQERFTVTVEMELRGAEVEKAVFHRSLIRSDERLDYDRVDRIFAGDERAAGVWAKPLAAARAAAAALEAKREAQKAMVIESSEPDFRFDGRGHVKSAAASEQTESHRLIEHLMIAANEAVARLLSGRGIPTLFRVHERPDPSAVERLVEKLAALGVPTPPLPEPLSPSQAADAIGPISRAVDAHVRKQGHGRRGLTTLVLRSLKQARYDPRNLGHTGLHSTAYCHFTSPIRRYPDLICHRALLSAIGAGEDAPRKSAMPEAAEWTSNRERDAMVIERDADDIARCFLLEQELFERGRETEFDGEIVSLIGAGAFVQFGNGYEGMLPVRKLGGGGDWWELDEHEVTLHGTRSGAQLRLGDRVRVMVERVEAPRGRVDLLPVAL
ncbi:MAG TPA: RNB domain-containing ribonuclease [Solirubrobacteraceae bacterium]|nr:RNB domain-containing ribonuclease [Solirubrobacteraceae bacterium]